MEDNKAGQQQRFNSSSLENPHCTLDTSLRLGLPGSPYTMDNNPNNLLAMNHSEQLNEVEDEHPNLDDSVANNQALVVSDFGSPSNNNNVNGFGHGVELPPVGLDHPWFINNGNNNDIFRRCHQYFSCRNMITRRHGWRRRKLSLSNRICRRCGTTSTPMWRRGPDGPQPLGLYNVNDDPPSESKSL